eukprot:Phypoly_transcript_13252.p1 GENE.Phypoly_transcript_13252~~Phypoly_transcript_13252.p1  ORF type:complete len:240 (+),score=11.56 Phypoly_transcript_13252:314-1033(+)
METDQNYIAQFTRSFFLPKRVLKGTRILVILYEFSVLLADYLRNWDGGGAFPRDFTALVMLLYFSVVLIVSYKFTKLSTHELSTSDMRVSKFASILFAITFTSTLFDTVVFWSLIRPKLSFKTITFEIIHFYALNLLIMIAECVWSLMVIPASRIIYIVLSSFAYVGVYFLWNLITQGVMLEIPHGRLPLGVVTAMLIIGIYVGSFWVVYAVVAFRNRLYTRGLFSREERYHILDSQSF